MDRSTGLRSDHTVILTPFNSVQAYPDPLRRVSYFDAETNKRLKFLTNNFTLPALTIAQIYKSRWQVELFFKWIKQHLRIKSFYGTSENAVKTQIWIAVSIYVLIAIVRKRLGLEASQLFAASESAGQWMVSDMRETGFLITTFGEDESGELYLTDFRKGAIYRLGAEQSAPIVSRFQPRSAVAGGTEFALLV